MNGKIKLALYWAASCGGCEIAVTELSERLLELIKHADIVFWPAAMDFKYQDVEAMPDDSIDICLFNGAIRTEENEHIAQLLRQKSKVLVAFGSCASEGCIPALANLTNREAMLARVYDETPSTENPEGVRPQTSLQVPEGEVNLPEVYDRVKTLGDTVQVDYTVPGCPPVADQIWKVIEAVLAGALPERGAVVGVDAKTVCDECERIKGNQKVKRFMRPHEVVADPTRCFLEQGIICAGPVTHAGCGRPCLHGGMPCRGCYGPAEGVVDQGAKLLNVVMSLIDSESSVEEVQKLVNEIVDPVGTFYRFSLAGSVLQHVKSNSKK